MDLIAYLRIFRRRWPLLVVPAVGALLIGWLTLPGQQQAGPVVETYSATATLIASPTYGTIAQAPLSLPTVALFSTLGAVPSKAAEQIGYDGEPQVLAAQVTVTPVADTSTLTISSTDAEADVVMERVNAFATATVDYFRDKGQAEAQGRVRALNRQVENTSDQLRDIQAQLAVKPDDAILQAQKDALQGEYSTQFGEIASLKQQLGGPGPLDLLQSGVAIPQTTGGFVAPTNALARLSIAAVLGLLLGAALALIVERIDSRLRTRDQVEEAFALPVLAEIPVLPWSQRTQREIISVERPASATAEAFRALRSAVLLHRPDGPKDGALEPLEVANSALGGTSHQGGTSHEGRSLVVLVTSALPGEGKTTTVANLAAVLAEAGRKVLILSLDLRNPCLHEYLDVANGTGISDLLAADRGEHLDQILRDTCLSGVQVATSGQQLDHPGALLASAGPMLDAARALADVTLIDTAPMLTVSDAVDLAQHVDVALIVSRLNKTTSGHAAASQRLLSRLGVPALGTVLVGSRPTGAQDGYQFGGLQGRGGRGTDDGEQRQGETGRDARPAQRGKTTGGQGDDS